MLCFVAVEFTERQLTLTYILTYGVLFSSCVGSQAHTSAKMVFFFFLCGQLLEAIVVHLLIVYSANILLVVTAFSELAQFSNIFCGRLWLSDYFSRY